jgi:formate hydrogenlyase subunit 3/multisubunit Na+/H+ antiporter MnhD subunit
MGLEDRMRRFLIVVGAVLLLVGIFWPWAGKLGLGRLPGDIHFERDGFEFYFPLTTGLIISAVVTLIFWLLRK